MLGAGDDLPTAPHRVLVAGVSGVGKTTFCQRVSRVLGIPHTEIDELFHGPRWQPRLNFIDDVTTLACSESWITEWQYGAAREILATRANTLVWLDLPFRITLARVVRRTVLRRITRQELWNGNREQSLIRAFIAPEGIIRWSIRTRHKYATLVPALAARHPEMAIIRLRTLREVEGWVTGALMRSRRDG